MNRKECEPQLVEPRHGLGVATMAIAMVMCLLTTQDVDAGSIRLWPAAVVVEDTVRLGDVAELSGFTSEEENRLGSTELGPAPVPGSILTVTLADLRTSLAASALNMSSVTLRGAVGCTVTRTATLLAENSQVEQVPDGRRRCIGTGPDSGDDQPGAQPAGDSEQTLRQAIIAHFNRELSRYGGSADVTFGAGSASLLDLSGPSYEFAVRQRSGATLGSVNLEVSVLADGQTVQSVSLRATVRLLRDVVTARGPINQDALIREKDVHVTFMYFSRLDGLGISDPVAIIGQRAKRFLEPGSVIEPADIEAVPLVIRGQIVAMESVEGGISISSSGKATTDGHLGQSIRVRDPNHKDVEIEAVVVGLGKVRIGGPASVTADRLALRSNR